MRKLVQLADAFLEKGAFAVLGAGLLLMLLLTLGNVVARWLGHSFLWIDPLARHLVFFIAFAGGVLAAGKGSHIKIEALAIILEKRKNAQAVKTVRFGAALVAAIVCGLLARAGAGFAQMEFEFGREAFLGLHSGVLAAIIPAGFGALAIRFVTVAILNFTVYEPVKE